LIEYRYGKNKYEPEPSYLYIRDGTPFFNQHPHSD